MQDKAAQTEGTFTVGAYYNLTQLPRQYNTPIVHIDENGNVTGMGPFTPCSLSGTTLTCGLMRYVNIGLFVLARTT